MDRLQSAHWMSIGHKNDDSFSIGLYNRQVGTTSFLLGNIYRQVGIGTTYSSF